MNKPKVILIAGPTGVGKTAASVHLARLLDTEIISCDSMQIYRGMDIGTAKVTADEAGGVCHHMIDVVNPSDNFSVADYVDMASPIVYRLASEGKPALVVGGTGLYADSLINGTEFRKDASADTEYREKLFALAETQGAETVHSLLRDADPESAQAIHPNNIKRVIRALEYFYVTGEKISLHNKQSKEKESPFESIRFYFTRDRDELYRRIDLRVDMMMEAGLESEVKELMDRGTGADTTAMQALGYKEMADAIAGKLSVGEAVELIKRGSRRYAKRQLTWFRRDTEGIWVNLDDTESPQAAAELCYEIIKERNML